MKHKKERNTNEHNDMNLSHANEPHSIFPFCISVDSIRTVLLNKDRKGR